jgi:hypothetical protein
MFAASSSRLTPETRHAPRVASLTDCGRVAARLRRARSEADVARQTLDRGRHRRGATVEHARLERIRERERVAVVAHAPGVVAHGEGVAGRGRAADCTRQPLTSMFEPAVYATFGPPLTEYVVAEVNTMFTVVSSCALRRIEHFARGMCRAALLRRAAARIGAAPRIARRIGDRDEKPLMASRVGWITNWSPVAAPAPTSATRRRTDRIGDGAGAGEAHRAPVSWRRTRSPCRSREPRSHSP